LLCVKRTSATMGYQANRGIMPFVAYGGAPH